MNVPAAVQKQVKDKLAEGIALAEKEYKQKFNMPTISYKLRGATAGKARLRTWTVMFNSILLMENLDDFIERTVPHELAHLITDKVYPDAHQGGVVAFNRFGRVRRKKRELHGWQWQSVMRVLGVKGDQASRCHSYDITNAQVKRRNQFQYKCSKPGCGEMLTVGPKRHKRLQRDPKAFWHRSCNGYKLELVGAAAQPKPVTPVQVPQMPLYGSTLPASTGTKQERAYNMYKADPAKSRAEMIDLFIAQLGMTKAGATTYYYNCQKKG